MIDRVSRRRVVVTTVRQGHRLKWEQEGSRNHSWSELVEGDLEPAHPIAVTFPASSEAIDALLGTKRGSPRVASDETKLAITNCASRGSARFETFGAVWHCRLLSILSSLFVDHPFFTARLHAGALFQSIPHESRCQQWKLLKRIV